MRLRNAQDNVNWQCHKSWIGWQSCRKILISWSLPIERQINIWLVTLIVAVYLYAYTKCMYIFVAINFFMFIYTTVCYINTWNILSRFYARSHFQDKHELFDSLIPIKLFNNDPHCKHGPECHKLCKCFSWMKTVISSTFFNFESNVFRLL